MSAAAATRRRAPSGPETKRDSLVSVAEAARRLGVSPRSVRRYLDEGRLEYGVLPSGRRMPSERSVDRFVVAALGGRL